MPELQATTSVVTHTVFLGLAVRHTHPRTPTPRGPAARGRPTRLEVGSCEALRVGRVLRREHLALDPVEGPDGRQVDLAQADS